MTNIYFIRHAESDYSVRNSRIRPLTQKGLADCALVTEFLRDKDIDIVLSSPYKRTVDTLQDFAEKNHFKILEIEDFREIQSNSGKINKEDFSLFMSRYWSDFNYKLPGGESLAECQERNINALKEVLAQHARKNIVIGTHGIALASILNYYGNTFGFENFMDMSFIFPWIVKMSFTGTNHIKQNAVWPYISHT